MGRAIDGVKGREWEERLRRYTDSQLTVGDFCVWEGVSVAAFYVWRKELGGGRRGRRSKGSAATAEVASGLSVPLSRESFLPVHVAERSVATAGVPAPQSITLVAPSAVTLYPHRRNTTENQRATQPEC